MRKDDKLYKVIFSICEDIGLDLTDDAIRLICETLTSHPLVYDALDITNINVKLIMYIAGLTEAGLAIDDIKNKTLKFVKSYYIKQTKELNKIMEY